MDLETFSKILGVGWSPQVQGDDTLDLTDMMHVKVTRLVDENLSVVLPSLLESELHTANVVLLLDDQTRLKAHKCFLSASPVLKEVLMSLEARLDKLPHISMPDFSKDCVVSFLHFLYKGFVVLENTDIQQEFLKLCRTLKVNPPVVRDDESFKPSTVPMQIEEPNSAFSDLSDDDVVNDDASNDIPIEEEEVQETLTFAVGPTSPLVQEQISPPSVELEKDTNSNVLIKEPTNVSKEKDPSNDESTFNVPKCNDSIKSNDTSQTSVTDLPNADVDDANIDPQSSSSVQIKDLKTIPSCVPDPIVGSTCDNLEKNSSLDFEMVNMEVPTEEDYDDETTEHISDFLNLLNTKSLNEKKAKEESLAEPEEELDSFDTFKMPDSFDIPQDYIKEIVPYSSATSTSVSFQVSDDEGEKKFTELSMPTKSECVPGSVDNIIKTEAKAGEATSEKHDKKIVRNLNFDDDIFKEEFIDNTPVQDEIEQITYKKDESSRRYRDSSKPKQKKAYNPKKDRKKVIASLFSDSDVDLPSTSSKKLSFKDNNDNRALTPSSEESRTPTPTTSLRNELEEKKERMKKKLKRSGGDDIEDPRLIEYRKKKKQMKEATPRKSHSTGSTPSKAHICNSSCMCVKNIRHEEDRKWLVDDTYESSDDRIGKSSESDETSDSNAKPEKKSSQKKKMIHKKRIIPAEDSSDEDTDLDEDPEDRRKRLDDRKKRKGGDVLAWMSRKGRVSVSVQTKPKGVILDMALYKMQLLAADGTDDSEHEAEPSKKLTDSESDDEIPRGKRISPVKIPSEDDLRKHKKKMKKHKKKRKRIRKYSPDPTFPVEEVVWTPAMYKKWDETKQKKGGGYDSDSDAPRSKHKKLHRSLSSEPKPSIESSKHHKSSQQPKIQRSMSTLESLGIAHNYGPSSLSKPATSLPKIPKLKKPDQDKL